MSSITTKNSFSNLNKISGSFYEDIHSTDPLILVISYLFTATFKIHKNKYKCVMY